MNKTFLVIFTVCLVLFLFGCTNQQDNNTSTEIKNTYTNLTISNPHQGEIVNGKISVNGTIQPLQDKEKLYVIVKPAGYGWWIQNAPKLNQTEIGVASLKLEKIGIQEENLEYVQSSARKT
ncbi:hypothetical protein [uncultured Methanobacterium sp.]|uniref:hypothetical protein n=1 Tax=uncultured Methanobacterium sp. TaxID=176306 RepID=UPI002AA7F486|nr:hypothetical protein [uncultured Methanobacterium sp.]